MVLGSIEIIKQLEKLRNKITELQTKITELKKSLTKIEEKLETPTEGNTLQVTVGTTAKQAVTEPRPVKAVTIKADDDNTGSVYIGFSSDVSTTKGFRLKAGQGVDIMIDDLSKIWLIADTENQKIHVIWVN